MKTYSISFYQSEELLACYSLESQPTEAYINRTLDQFYIQDRQTGSMVSSIKYKAVCSHYGEVYSSYRLRLPEVVNVSVSNVIIGDTVLKDGKYIVVNDIQIIKHGKITVYYFGSAYALNRASAIVPVDKDELFFEFVCLENEYIQVYETDDMQYR